VTGDLDRLQALQAAADQIMSALPVWCGESSYLLVTVVDPETSTRIAHQFVPVAEPASRPVRHLRVVREAS